MLRAHSSRRWSVRCLVVALTLWAAVPLQDATAQEEKYVAGIPDLPLMPGLDALPDSGVVFDKPGGRIVEAFAEGGVKPNAVIAFYDQTLPQLGWEREASGAYLRDGERLKLDFSEQAGRITVHFRLLPE